MEKRALRGVAAESKAAVAIRRYLTDECGLPKRNVTCMGYWRLGKVTLTAPLHAVVQRPRTRQLPKIPRHPFDIAVVEHARLPA
ncbi:SIP domain-containing protein [Billgrantia endophytica]|uniref:SIP-like Rossmann fold domain-containing protein n=1 Tax=Billgrantia endophytica TaxID=2033802 RepID=A0A2N7TXC3_9GAMM|nr:SIP domain-containing protein [Halomonas endophytica]PMR72844.1 hypothetical protein C1H69_19565 [Halomonas endophytica]